MGNKKNDEYIVVKKIIYIMFIKTLAKRQQKEERSFIINGSNIKIWMIRWIKFESKEWEKKTILCVDSFEFVW